jgi:hypothetical protein
MSPKSTSLSNRINLKANVLDMTSAIAAEATTARAAELTLTNNQQKLDSFLNWGATDRSAAMNVLLNNGYKLNQKILNAAGLKDDNQEIGELAQYRFLASALQYMVNVGLTTIARYFSNPDTKKPDGYMTTVYSQIDKLLPMDKQISAEFKKYYEGKKASDLVSKEAFTPAFNNILIKQLQKVQG